MDAPTFLRLGFTVGVCDLVRLWSGGCLRKALSQAQRALRWENGCPPYRERV